MAQAVTYDLCLRTAATIQAGDLAAAEAFLSVIALTLKDAALLPHQRVYLYRLRKVWGRRAAGEDLRWNVLGSRPGAPKRQKEKTDEADQRDTVLRDVLPDVFTAPAAGNSGGRETHGRDSRGGRETHGRDSRGGDDDAGDGANHLQAQLASILDKYGSS